MQAKIKLDIKALEVQSTLSARRNLVAKQTFGSDEEGNSRIARHIYLAEVSYLRARIREMPSVGWMEEGVLKPFFSHQCISHMAVRTSPRQAMFRLNVFIANTKQRVGPQVFPTLVTALPLQYTYKALHRQWRTYLSRDMRFPTKRCVRPAKAQTSLRIRAV